MDLSTFHQVNAILDFIFKILVEKGDKDLWENVIFRTFCDFKLIYLHVHCTSTLVFWWEKTFFLIREGEQSKWGSMYI